MLSSSKIFSSSGTTKSGSFVKSTEESPGAVIVTASFTLSAKPIITFVDLAEEQELAITEEQLVLVFSKDEPANMLESWSYNTDGANFRETNYQ